MSVRVNRASSTKCAIIGGGIALLVILLFILPVKEPNPAWPQMWRIRPLVITPLAGAFGGVVYYLINNLFDNPGWKRIVVLIVSILLYIFMLWLGMVLGLDGTLWD